MKIGIIGAGGVARGVHIPALRRIDGVEIAGIAREHKSEPVDGIPVTKHYQDLLARADIGAIINTTPNHLHRQITLDALAAGKHVLCEKPLGLNHGETLEMLAAAEKSGLVHMTAFTFRYAPGVQYLKHLIETGALGQIRSVRAAYLMALSEHLTGWRSQRPLAGSGALADIGSHAIHIAQFLAGQIAAVSAAGRSFYSDVDDWIGFLAQFACGAMATFEISRAAPGRGDEITENMFIEIYGTRGGAAFSMQDPWALMLCIGERARDAAANLERTPAPQEFLKLPGSPRDIHADDPRWGYRYDQDFQFVDSIRQREVREPSFRAGAECQAVLDAVLKSCEDGRWTPVAAP
ncbi:MAG TPA: Gfo/Idh/MocA family oxidoreductase [Bryobacterales bacterium]|nr:Gfo/Idh/MocA family oxidoreductase [Bryobacterales bacterium]